MLLLLLALAPAASVSAQTSHVPRTIMTLPVPPPPSVGASAALTLEEPMHEARRSVAPVVAPAVVGAATFALSWIGTFVGTLIWYFDSTHCTGTTIRIRASDRPRNCTHDGPNDDALGASFIPIAGPWIMLNTPNVDPAFPVAMGILQSVGLLTLVIGVPLGIVAVSNPEAPRVAFRGEPGGGRFEVSGRF